MYTEDSQDHVLSVMYATPGKRQKQCYAVPHMFTWCHHLSSTGTAFFGIKNILKISTMLHFSCWSYDKTSKARHFMRYSNMLSLG